MTTDECKKLKENILKCLSEIGKLTEDIKNDRKSLAVGLYTGELLGFKNFIKHKNHNIIIEGVKQGKVLYVTTGDEDEEINECFPEEITI